MHQRRWIKQAIGVGALAVGVALVVWIGGRGPTPEVKPVAPPVDASTPVSTSALTEDEQGRVSRALASGRLELPANISVLRGHAGILLGAGDSALFLVPSAPIGTAVIEARPQFSWTSMAGATRYSVKVFDERFREVANSGPLKGTKWTPARSLPRGRVLAWQITAVTREGTVTSPEPPQPEARFVILDSATVTSIAKARTRLSTEPIALGLTLAKVGLFADAESVLESALSDERYEVWQVRALIARLRAR